MSLRSVEAPREPEDQLVHPDYFSDAVVRPALAFQDAERFHFPSPLPSAERENNTVAGRLIPAKPGRARRAEVSGGKGPAVILLHGWNGEQGYRFLFPLLGWRFSRLGLTTAMIELPYHGSRKPRDGPFRNFLSGDVVHMMEATRQAIADIRSMAAWLRGEGYGPVGLWGLSLGAWLGGVVTCCEEELGAAVLVTPIPRIDQAIEELEFCRHIRSSLHGRSISPRELNLTECQPKISPKRILIVESIYDLFAPAAAVEELWRLWGRTEIWRVKHGHISVLASPVIMNRTGKWLERRLAATSGEFEQSR